ncbi:hypothetical protein BCV69DRAFT_61468 [Microstroma glucosiphilum]|uniref:Uncharacterized protein n=1 Tax=Pseudomicrostroma glucosiphilum TaxID=1684307 RepID=A0A316U1L2_9BASI|nr:hypothetical protein BCV69DRAFT_61468 [Pseudomicrostroma glucosiphilum]PWN18738.1 hypothetical protein BCV69DRAFT_61468 [Pseudomicrostroma glucosiphilum]
MYSYNLPLVTTGILCCVGIMGTVLVSHIPINSRFNDLACVLAMLCRDPHPRRAYMMLPTLECEGRLSKVSPADFV